VQAAAFTITDELRAIVGQDYVITDPAECAYIAQDVFTRGLPAGAQVLPANKQELAELIGCATAAGIAVVARGGGMSYTSGYVPVEENSIVVDMSRMNQLLELNREDMYVTVEAGISWQKLNESLEGSGLRTAYWGTLSGRFATVGGGLSQNSIFWGSARHGTAADSVLCMEVVLADGSIVNTGSASQVNSTPFFRHFGPDLTGLFTGDCGALGFKATATLRLVPQQEAQEFGSFAFERYEDMVPAMSEIARADIVTECFGFDPYLQSQRMKRESIASDAKNFMGALKSAGGVGKAIKEGAKMALAGRHFMDDVKWSFHVMLEARTEASARLGLEKVRQIVSANNGRELTDSIPRLVKANPFGPVNNMLGPEGERWVPVHGVVPHSRVIDTLSKVEALFEMHSEQMQQLGIATGYLLATVSTTGFVIEPVFFWPDEIMEIHRRSVEPDHLKRLKGFEQNLPARAAVTAIKEELLDLFEELGAVHFQVAKCYRYKEGLRTESFALVQALKNILDPNNRINPGTLGLNT
jgi:glycolate oxidase